MTPTNRCDSCRTAWAVGEWAIVYQTSAEGARVYVYRRRALCHFCHAAVALGIQVKHDSRIRMSRVR